MPAEIGKAEAVVAGAAIAHAQSVATATDAIFIVNPLVDRAK
jgi:hypothetical protein